MEYVDGRTLEHELRERGPLPVHEIVAIGLALSGAVEAVHAAGLLHRDIKAQNVMRARDGRVLLADFGATREVTRETGGLELAGTPLYLAPEILRGGPASAASAGRKRDRARCSGSRSRRTPIPTRRSSSSRRTS